MTQEKIIKLPRMRTLDECYKEIKRLDSNSAVSKYFIRQLALSGAIPAVMAGNKRLINLDGLINYLNNSQTTAPSEPPQNGIRKIY